MESGFNVKLAQLMAAKGLNQVQLAKRSGLTQGAISLLLLGKRAPGMDTILKLSRALNVSVDELMGITPAQIKQAQADIEKGKITEDERILLERYKALPDNHWLKQAIKDVLKRSDEGNKGR